MELRPYQQEAKEAIFEQWDSGVLKTLLVLPTGCGKTVVFAKVTEDCVRQGSRVLILTTPKQIRFLEGRGFQHVGTWQFETAKNLIDRIAGNGWRVPSDIVPQEYKGA